MNSITMSGALESVHGALQQIGWLHVGYGS